MSKFEWFVDRLLFVIFLLIITIWVVWLLIGLGNMLTEVADKATSTHITQRCVDEKIVIRGPGWRAWKIDSTNRPERC